MVKELGMSRLGRVSFQERNGPHFLGGVADGERAYSEQTAREIDVEVQKIIEDATQEVRAVLRARRSALEIIARRLMDKEVMDGAELREILAQAGLPAPPPMNGLAPQVIADPVPPPAPGNKLAPGASQL
jgi:cell division protease FtsH